METITASKFDETFSKLNCSQGVLYELSEAFTFQAANYEFHPSFRNGSWDGTLKLFNLKTRQIYTGLLPDVEKFCLESGYVFKNEISPPAQFNDEQIQKFIDVMELPFKPYDYQFEGLKFIINNNRCLIKSPTNSGKSLIQYLAIRFFRKKTLIVVPTVSLVLQLAKDFGDYGYKKEIKQIKSGVDKNNIENDITISTYQSLKNQSVEWFSQFDFIMGDEVHTFTAKSLVDLMKKCTGQKIKVGLTGTLPEDPLDLMTLRGLFGNIFETTTNKELIDRGISANTTIKCLELLYPKEIQKAFKHFIKMNKGASKAVDFSNELVYINTLESRVRFLIKFIFKLKGNRLLLFRRNEFGERLYELLKKIHPRVYLVNGDIKAEVREEIRQIMEATDDVIVVASYGTFSTGINIKNMQHLIFGETMKSMIKILQSIGRLLRVSETKKTATLWDLADHIIPTGRSNYAWQHFKARLVYYTKEEFPTEIVKINIG